MAFNEPKTFFLRVIMIKTPDVEQKYTRFENSIASSCSGQQIVIMSIKTKGISLTLKGSNKK
jgi:hypothetical protein